MRLRRPAAWILSFAKAIPSKLRVFPRGKRVLRSTHCSTTRGFVRAYRHEDVVRRLWSCCSWSRVQVDGHCVAPCCGYPSHLLFLDRSARRDSGASGACDLDSAIAGIASEWSEDQLYPLRLSKSCHGLNINNRLELSRSSERIGRLPSPVFQPA